ncbi:transposase [Paraburkholderia sp. SIMBA_030]|uniref:transposase n=1 Tax=Paraburkholderia sp. SIMBA_030 TaxID=3085773 RepID=UPI003978EDCB
MHHPRHPMARSLSTHQKNSAGTPNKRPNFPVEFKRRLVEQTFEPGASVSLIARRNDVNINWG